MEIFTGALIFSIWCITLFFGKQIGLSMLLFAVPITLFIIYILEINRKQVNTKAKVLVIPITLLSATYCIFNNTFFNSINVFVIPLLVIYMILELLKDRITFSLSLIGKIVELLFFPLNYIGMTLKKQKVHFEVDFNFDEEKASRMKEIFRAIIITLPIAIIIIGLLASADMIFENLVSSISNIFSNVFGVIEFNNFFVRVILTFLVFVYLLCFFDYIVSRYQIDTEIEEDKKVETDYVIKMVLGVLNVIYFVFCIIQIKSLFLKNVNINYSEYARQGFFQLMFVSVINLITILIAKKAEKRDKSMYIVVMCLVMILFTFIILVSSVIRMYYYESAYGYTLLRLLVYCALFAEAMLLIPTIMYVIDINIDLMRTYIAIIITIYVGMNFMNFDNMIAQKNIDRYFETGNIDIYYLKTHTETDAIKQILRLTEVESKEDFVQSEAEEYLKQVYKELKEEKMDFRDFNFSKVIAKDLLQDKLSFEEGEE